MTNKLKNFLKEYYFLIIPAFITILLYSISLTYGFRNFDEDINIKNFYVKKTFWEYVEKYLLTSLSGITSAEGFSFSSIQNVHWCILERPLEFLAAFLFKDNAFPHHLMGLLLQCLVVFIFVKLCYKITSDKYISLFSGLIWTLHPVNVESVVWATNWNALLVAALYFWVLEKCITNINSRIPILFIFFLTIIQVSIFEFCVSLPLILFLIVFYKSTTSRLRTAIKFSLPAFIAIGIYFIARIIFVSKSNSSYNNISDIIERIIYLTPQTFVHNLKLVLFPQYLTIDQLDLLKLDKLFLGSYNIFCLIVFISFITFAFICRNKLSYLSFGLFAYIASILPSLQIVPLYSIVAERYNYYGSAFLIFGIIASLFNLFKKKRKILLTVLITISLALGVRSYLRITDWKDSQALFLSTANTSKSLLKKGIWTYNIALSEEDENKKNNLLKVSANLLNLFIENTQEFKVPDVLEKYELDYNSLISKAHLRLAKIYEILGNPNLEHEHLTSTLKFAKLASIISAKSYLNLATLYFQQSDYKKAIEYYEKSYSISPNSTINFAIAVCNLKLDNIDNYGKYLKLATENPSNSDPRAHLPYGQFLELEKGDYKGAVKHYKIATLLEDKVEPYILLATLYLKLNESDKALKIVKNGLYGFPKNPTLNYFYEALKTKETLMVR